MTQDIQGLARIIRSKRQAANMPAIELARRAGVTSGTITRLESGQIAEPRPATLKAIADALDVPARELLVAGDYLESDDLPSFTPYLRSRYGYLSASARSELQAAFNDIARRHGSIPDPDGPRPGEDES